ncbi:hypothetical protein PR048_022467 [Dryococelus australis]|uniref:Uncharacterized protein n=1 Tax=Dryococelus australis TaxID=614101 RepID=A0ABQ9H162_9NEOP|nr:hypothetical protein PR048_022467 [Dryococelus australis]
MVSLYQCENKPLVIFDDVILEVRIKILMFFILGRHIPESPSNYYEITKFSVDFVGGDMSFENFKEICAKCWDEDYGFITKDMNRKMDGGKYRGGGWKHLGELGMGMGHHWNARGGGKGRFPRKPANPSDIVRRDLYMQKSGSEHRLELNPEPWMIVPQNTQEYRVETATHTTHGMTLTNQRRATCSPAGSSRHKKYLEARDSQSGARPNSKKSVGVFNTPCGGRDIHAQWQLILPNQANRTQWTPFSLRDVSLLQKSTTNYMTIRNPHFRHLDQVAGTDATKHYGVSLRAHMCEQFSAPATDGAALGRRTGETAVRQTVVFHGWPLIHTCKIRAFNDLQARLYGLMCSRADIDCSLVTCCHGGERRLGVNVVVCFSLVPGSPGGVEQPACEEEGRGEHDKCNCCLQRRADSMLDPRLRFEATPSPLSKLRTDSQRQEGIVNLAESIYSLIRRGEMKPCKVIERVAEIIKNFNCNCPEVSVDVFLRHVSPNRFYDVFSQLIASTLLKSGRRKCHEAADIPPFIISLDPDSDTTDEDDPGSGDEVLAMATDRGTRLFYCTVGAGWPEALIVDALDVFEPIGNLQGEKNVARAILSVGRRAGSRRINLRIVCVSLSGLARGFAPHKFANVCVAQWVGARVRRHKFANCVCVAQWVGARVRAA